MWKNVENLFCNIVHCVFYCNFNVTFLTLLNTVFPAHISVYVVLITVAALPSSLRSLKLTFFLFPS